MKGKVYLLAGHSKQDPGAVNNESGLKESELTMELRELVVSKLRQASVIVEVDEDHLSLGEVVSWINRRSYESDIVCDIHFNSFNGKATGTEVLIPNGYSDIEYRLAEALSKGISEALGIPNRGVKTEASSHRKTLAIMRPCGANILIEICFLDNKNDITTYLKKKEQVADLVAKIIISEIL